MDHVFAANDCVHVGENDGSSKKLVVTPQKTQHKKTFYEWSVAVATCQVVTNCSKTKFYSGLCIVVYDVWLNLFVEFLSLISFRNSWVDRWYFNTSERNYDRLEALYEWYLISNIAWLSRGDMAGDDKNPILRWTCIEVKYLNKHTYMDVTLLDIRSIHVYLRIVFLSWSTLTLLDNRLILYSSCIVSCVA